MEEQIRLTSSRRGRLEVKLDILRAATEPTLKTRLMQKTNMSWAPLKAYLEELLSKGLIETRDVPMRTRRARRTGRYRNLYKTTKKGLEAITHLEALASIK